MDRYATLRNGLIAALCPSLGHSGGLLIDRSPYRRNGTLTGSWGATGGGGASFSVSGGTQGTAAASATVFGIDHSVSLWVYPTSYTSAYHALFDKGSGELSESRVLINTSGNMSYFSNGTVGGFPNVPLALTTGRWHHFCMTLTAGLSLTVYSNGIARGTLTANTITSRPSVPWSFGSNPTSTTAQTFNGAYDDIRIYSRVLTPAEIRLLASQRGIGLLPTRHRRASLLSQFWTRISGEWKRATPWINVGGTWKQSTPKIKVGATWKG